MIKEKSLGIWMDHSNAHAIAFTTDPIETKSIESKFTHPDHNKSTGKGENLMHNKEQHEQAAYYKNLGELIKDYKDVVLFGPTHAKSELFNLLKADQQFEKIRIEVKQCDKMTENQQHAFVREHFTTH